MNNFTTWKDYYFTENKDDVQDAVDSFKFSEVGDNMLIYIPEQYKKKVLIRKINSYFKDKKMKSKIVNDISLANTIVLSKKLLSANNYSDISAEYNPTGIVDYVTNTYSYNSNSYYGRKMTTGNTLKQVYCIYSNYAYVRDNKFIVEYQKINNLGQVSFAEASHHMILSNKYKFIQLSDLIEITRDQYVQEADNIDITMNNDKIKSMLSTLDGTDLFCNAMRGKDLSSYLVTIIEAYYTVGNQQTRLLIRNKLLKNYKLAEILSRNNNYDFYRNREQYYMKTMSEMELVPDKEMVLNLVNYYTWVKKN
jgi:hypothetical protein